MNASMDISAKPLLARLADGAVLPADEAEAAFGALLDGGWEPAQVAGFLTALRVRGEAESEILGGARALRARMIPATAPAGAIDTCGTGGDTKGTQNISTAAAVVIAACGVPVAKHGNRSVSSKSGSSEVLAALGVNIEAPLPRLEQALAEAGIAFLWAPRHHPVMREVADLRRSLGFRTIFNLLGPLANPAGVRHQVLGVFAPEWLEPMARTLKALGTERAWLIHGADGLDELSTTGPSQVVELRDGQLRSFTVTPEEAGLPRAALTDLSGGGPAANAKALQEVLAGVSGPFRDITILNAAAGLVVAGAVESLKDGAAAAGHAIDSGRAAVALAALRDATQDPAAGTMAGAPGP